VALTLSLEFYKKKEKTSRVATKTLYYALVKEDSAFISET
jgi:hypothetical protein